MCKSEGKGEVVGDKVIHSHIVDNNCAWGRKTPIDQPASVLLPSLPLDKHVTEYSFRQPVLAWKQEPLSAVPNKPTADRKAPWMCLINAQVGKCIGFTGL